MQIGKRLFLAASVLIAAFAVSSVGHAAIITTSLGNTAPGFNDGDTPDVPTVGAAQGGQPAPFDTSYGTDGLFGGNFGQSWTHTFAAIADPIVSASMSFGIYDHDSSASGSQVALFQLEGSDFTSTLDALFESGGGADNEYNVYTIDLSSILASLADGSFSVTLNLQGPGLVPDLFGGGFVETSTNGANLIFSTLTIETENGQVPVPDPATLSLALLAFGTLLWRRREYALAAIRRR